MHGEAKLLLNFLDGSDNQIQYFIEGAQSVVFTFSSVSYDKEYSPQKKEPPLVSERRLVNLLSY